MRRLTDDRDMITDADFSSVFSIDPADQALNISLPVDWTN